MKRALVVGINNYPTAPLRACINDATAIGSLIQSNEDHSPNFSVKLETKVSSKAVLAGLIKELFKGDCETALFYFSGHGLVNELGGYIVTPDAARNNEGISMDDILKIANRSEAVNKIIILDCCYAGAIGQPIFDTDSIIHIKNGVTILAASRSGESAIESGDHGLFTSLLLDALKGGAADLRGHITAGSLYAYVDQALGPWQQRPVFKTNSTRFIPIRTVSPQVKIEVLRNIVVYFPNQDHEFPLTAEYEYTTPRADVVKIEVFRHLQELQDRGLVVPVGEEYMYWAAINGKSCRLTALGRHYWKLVNDKRI